MPLFMLTAQARSSIGCFRVRGSLSLIVALLLFLDFLMLILKRPKIHDENVIDNGKMHYMYDNAYGNVKFGETSGLTPYYKFMNQLLRYTISPKGGNLDKISNMSRNLLAKMTPGASEFSVFDFLWEEIISTSISPKKGCHYSPYIFHMIKEVTGINILADQNHLVYRPNKGTVD